MKAQINKQGLLEVFRSKEYALQFCPWTVRESPCGDWCPLFRESANKPLSVLLQCSEAAYYEDVVDVRGYNK